MPGCVSDVDSRARVIQSTSREVGCTDFQIVDEMDVAMFSPKLACLYVRKRPGLRLLYEFDQAFCCSLGARGTTFILYRYQVVKSSDGLLINPQKWLENG